MPRVIKNDLEYINQWKRQNMKRFAFELNLTHDKQLVQWLEKNKPYNTYIKRLIREDYEQNKIKV